VTPLLNSLEKLATSFLGQVSKGRGKVAK